MPYTLTGHGTAAIKNTGKVCVLAGIVFNMDFRLLSDALSETGFYRNPS